MTHPTTGTYRVRPNDVERAASTVAGSAGPLECTNESVRQSLEVLSKAPPSARTALTVSTVSRDWPYDPSLVVERSAHFPDTTDIGTLVSRDNSHSPYRAAVREDALYTLLDHGIGDGLTFLLLTGSVGTRHGLVELPEWTHWSDRFSAIDTALSVIRRDPKLLRKWWGTRDARRVQLPSDLEQLPLSSKPTLTYAKIPCEAFSEIEKWRRSSSEPMSSTAVIAVALGRSLEREGIEISSHIHTLFDCRRYASNPNIIGNLAAGANIPCELSASPAAFSRSIQETAASAAPLFTLAAVEARTTVSLLANRLAAMAGSSVKSRDSLPPTEVSAHALTLAISDVGTPPPIRDLPWAADPDDCEVRAGLTTASPNSMTASISRVRGVLHMSLTYDAGRCDPLAVQRAVDRLSDGSLDLLGA